jgi:o-succinylbenzoate synthase
MTASVHPYRLQFKKPVLTSRGSMDYKNGYYIIVENNGIRGIGECSYIEGLSIDRLDTFEKQLTDICSNIDKISDLYYEDSSIPHHLISEYPSIAFGLETALMDLRNGGKRLIIADSKFYQGNQDIPINGLIWMGDDDFMQQQIAEKLTDGFRCIKIKVGAIDFKEECRLIENIRKQYDASQIEIRLDANGGFNEQNVRERLKILSQYTIHSIEQPVKPQQYLLMRSLCMDNIIPVALDEELIGTDRTDFRIKLLETIRPQYIILKPSLLGGLAPCDEWIGIAEKLNVGWWATSALESNIGLNAIAQWAASAVSASTLTGTRSMYQGLGTGSLYVNNIASPLYIEAGHLKYNPAQKWAEFPN